MASKPDLIAFYAKKTGLDSPNIVLQFLNRSLKFSFEEKEFLLTKGSLYNIYLQYVLSVAKENRKTMYPKAHLSVADAYCLLKFGSALPSGAVRNASRKCAQTFCDSVKRRLRLFTLGSSDPSQKLSSELSTPFRMPCLDKFFAGQSAKVPRKQDSLQLPLPIKRSKKNPQSSQVRLSMPASSPKVCATSRSSSLSETFGSQQQFVSLQLSPYASLTPISRRSSSSLSSSVSSPASLASPVSSFTSQAATSPIPSQAAPPCVLTRTRYPAPLRSGSLFASPSPLLFVSPPGSSPRNLFSPARCVPRRLISSFGPSVQQPPAPDPAPTIVDVRRIVNANLQKRRSLMLDTLQWIAEEEIDLVRTYLKIHYNVSSFVLNVDESCSLFFKLGLSHMSYTDLRKYLKEKVHLADPKSIRTRMESFVPKIEAFDTEKSCGSYFSMRSLATDLRKQKRFVEYSKTHDVLYYLISGDGYHDSDCNNSHFCKATQLCGTFTGVPGSKLFDETVASVNYSRTFSLVFEEESSSIVKMMFQKVEPDRKALEEEGIVIDGKRMKIVSILRSDLKFANLIYGVSQNRCIHCNVSIANLNKFDQRSLKLLNPRDMEEMQRIGKKMEKKFLEEVQPYLEEAVRDHCLKEKISISNLSDKARRGIEHATEQFIRWKNQVNSECQGQFSTSAVGIHMSHFIYDNLHMKINVWDYFERRFVNFIWKHNPDKFKTKKDARKHYRSHMKKLRIHRKFTGYIGREVNKCFARHENVLKILGNPAVEKKYDELIKIFIDIQTLWSSKTPLSAEQISVLGNLCRFFGRSLNRLFPKSRKGRSMYIHALVVHGPELAVLHRNLVLGTCQATEATNAALKFIFRRHVAKGPFQPPISKQILGYAVKLNSSVVIEHTPEKRRRLKKNQGKKVSAIVDVVNRYQENFGTQMITFDEAADCASDGEHFDDSDACVSEWYFDDDCEDDYDEDTDEEDAKDLDDADLDEAADSDLGLENSDGDEFVVHEFEQDMRFDDSTDESDLSEYDD
jgi:hypothetical protein